MAKLEIEYTIECLPEDIPIRGNAMASGDPEIDGQYEQQIIEDLESGNEWAWCCVKVTARVPGIDIDGTDYLGGCSYKSEEEFCQPGGYWDDMKEEARADLLRQLRELKRQLIQLEVDVLSEADEPQPESAPAPVAQAPEPRQVHLLCDYHGCPVSRCGCE